MFSKYRRAVGSQLYLSVTSQPDNASANIQFLQDDLKAPTHSDWNEIQHIMRYLKDDSCNRLRLKLESKIELNCYVDADWVGIQRIEFNQLNCT